MLNLEIFTLSISSTGEYSNTLILVDTPMHIVPMLCLCLVARHSFTFHPEILDCTSSSLNIKIRIYRYQTCKHIFKYKLRFNYLLWILENKPNNNHWTVQIHSFFKCEYLNICSIQPLINTALEIK